MLGFELGQRREAMRIAAEELNLRRREVGLRERLGAGAEGRAQRESDFMHKAEPVAGAGTPLDVSGVPAAAGRPRGPLGTPGPYRDQRSAADDQWMRDKEQYTEQWKAGLVGTPEAERTYQSAEGDWRRAQRGKLGTPEQAPAGLVGEAPKSRAEQGFEAEQKQIAAQTGATEQGTLESKQQVAESKARETRESELHELDKAERKAKGTAATNKAKADKAKWIADLSTQFPGANVDKFVKSGKAADLGKPLSTKVSEEMKFIMGSDAFTTKSKREAARTGDPTKAKPKSKLTSKQIDEMSDFFVNEALRLGYDTTDWISPPMEKTGKVLLSEEGRQLMGAVKAARAANPGGTPREWTATAMQELGVPMIPVAELRQRANAGDTEAQAILLRRQKALRKP